MSTKKKLLAKVLSGSNDGNITFAQLVHLLEILGWSIRQTGGSHRVASHPEAEEILNVQPKKDGKAKPYQIEQVRECIKKYNLDRYID